MITKRPYSVVVVLLTCAAVLAASSCQNEAKPPETTVTVGALSAGCVIDSSDDLAASPFQDWTQQLLGIAGDAKAVFGTISGAVGAVTASITILRFLGILAPADDEVADLQKYVGALGTGLTYQALIGDLYHDWNNSMSAMQLISENGNVVVPNDDNDRATLNALDNLLSPDDWTRGQVGSPDDIVTDGQPMYGPQWGTTSGTPGEMNSVTWKQVIKGGPYVAPGFGGSPGPGQVFEWRYAAPFALKALANRLVVLGLMDPNFTTDGRYNQPEISFYYNQLVNIYNQMNTGIQCGSTDYWWSNIYNGFGSYTEYFACAVVCADIYSGYAELSAITPPTETSSVYCENIKTTEQYQDTVNQTAAQLRQTMPLFEIKAAIDTLYRILNPSEDLTTTDGMIAPTTEADVCIGGANGQVAYGTPLQLSYCNKNDPSQVWSYSRVTGQISNVANPTVCIESPGTTQGFPASMMTCEIPHPAQAEPTGPAVEIYNVFQKWTYSPQGQGSGGNLLSGSGLALGWQSLASNGYSLWPDVGTSLVSSVYLQGSGFIDPSTDGTSTILSANLDWRSNGPAFSPPADLGSGGQLSSAPAVADREGNWFDVFWTDSSNHLRQAEGYGGGTWAASPSQPWDVGPDPAPPGNSPAAASWAPGRLDLVQLGSTQGGCQLFHLWGNPSWQYWETLNEPNQPALNCNYDVAISSWGELPGDRLDIFANNAQTGEVWHLAFDRSLGGWQSWEDLGGYATSTPAAVSFQSGRIDVVVRGGDNAIYWKYFSGGVWYPSQTGWISLGGNMPALNPTITSYQPGRLDVFAASSGQMLNHIAMDNYVWTPWTNMGYGVPSQPRAASWGPPQMAIFARDGNGALWLDSAQ